MWELGFKQLRETKHWSPVNWNQRISFLFPKDLLEKTASAAQRAISYYETEADFPIASALIPLARALRVTTDELLGVKPAKFDQGKPRSRRLWKRFQRMASLRRC